MLFCCKGCLRGDGDTMELYKLIGLDTKKATHEDIRKAYKKKSLSLHPDKLKQRGIAVTDESAKEFLRVKEAYEILSDKKRRGIYDQVGLNGLKLIENPTEVDPMVFLSNFQKNRKDRVVLIFILLVIFAIIFFLPVLFALKCDGSLDGMPWFAIWIPMWIVDAILLITALLLFTMDTSDPADKKGDKDKETDQLGGARDNTAEDEEDEDENKVVVSMHEKVMNLVSTLLFIAIQVLVLAQMDHAINLSWFAVFIPWFLYEALGFVATVQAALEPVPLPDHNDPSLVSDLEEAMPDDVSQAHFALEMKYFDEVHARHGDKKSAVTVILRLWLALFLAMQLNTGYSESYNWGLIFLPMWLYLAMELGTAYYWKTVGDALLDGLDPESLTEEHVDWKVMVKVTQAQQLAANCQLTYILVCIFPLLMTILAVCKLQGSSYSTFIILIPILTVLSCACLCVFGAFFMLANIDPEKMDEEIKAQHQQHGGGGGDGRWDASEERSYGATGDFSSTEVSSATIPLPDTYSPPPVVVVAPPPAPDVVPVAAPAPTSPAVMKTEDIHMDMID